MKIAAGKSAGKAALKRWSASTPPAEVPITTMSFVGISLLPISA
jgi:hypothetical protein